MSAINFGGAGGHSGKRVEFSGFVKSTSVGSDRQCEIVILVHAHSRKIVFEYVIKDGLAAASGACGQNVDGFVDTGCGYLEIETDDGVITGRMVMLHLYDLRQMPGTVGPGMPPTMGRAETEPDPMIDGYGPP